MRIARLSILSFLLGFLLAFLVVSQAQFLWQAFHHGGW